MSESENTWSPRTHAISTGRPRGATEPLNTPIVPASTLGSQYAREDGTETWAALEDAIGALEGGAATAFASGAGAVSAVFGLLPAGSEIAVPADSYAGTRSSLEHAERMGHLRGRQLDPRDTDAWVEAAAEVDLLWLESPTNPSLYLMDIPAIARAAAAAPHRPRVAVDNTFATPIGQQPLAHGADIVVHSATKLIGGHSDLLLGLTVTGDEGLHGELRQARTHVGATPGALEAWLALRGLRTLPVRLDAASRSAAILAERLTEHPAVIRTRYPGTGTMIAFELADGTSADRLCADVALIRHATSLGGVESTLERRASRAGDTHLAPGFIRLSVGLEEPEDLWRDLSSVLDVLPA